MRLVQWTEDLEDELEAKVGGVDAAAGPRGAMFDELAPTIQKVCCEVLYICTYINAIVLSLK